ncbi:sugar kinase [Gilvimarinus sp. SDUM040013]|uniref:Sugar kinase n=1 Tax=Gilvimarinus gilvus TaxID=3058038 RepID=A0ABU4S0A3_9GAMM|nr:sugar kinase [Gilvimarinus sp. SDUM040013]MDO3385912.1 sugar kinase [Gilvimarinus sp. SDUM040013]MDX6850585.1 sugar kinase [Gilvimarinus sp. SDUM040013]
MKIAAIGECMLEMSSGSLSPDQAKIPAHLGYGGDTLNTAVYLARLGSQPSFVTVMGEDQASRWMTSQWRHNGVDTSLVKIDSNKRPGVYHISNDENGERHFIYWRNDSAAKYILDSDAKMTELKSQLTQFDCIYLSGISLAILDAPSQDRLFTILQELRSEGKKIVFDGNYRPILWESTDLAQKAFSRAYAISDIALPTIDDESLLFGESDKDAVIERIRRCGALEIILKMGAEGCCIDSGESRFMVTGRKVSVVDTTSAGDSFNAAYLHYRSQGAEHVVAAQNGHTLASTVIQHKGAIIAESDMPSF